MHNNNSQFVRNGANKPNLINKRFSHQNEDLSQLENLGAKKYNSQEKAPSQQYSRAENVGLEQAGEHAQVK